MIAYIPLVVAVVGLVLWALSSKPIPSEVGRWMFVIGLFWFLAPFTGETVRLLR